MNEFLLCVSHARLHIYLYKYVIIIYVYVVLLYVFMHLLFNQMTYNK